MNSFRGDNNIKKGVLNYLLLAVFVGMMFSMFNDPARAAGIPKPGEEVINEERLEVNADIINLKKKSIDSKYEKEVGPTIDMEKIEAELKLLKVANNSKNIEGRQEQIEATKKHQEKLEAERLEAERKRLAAQRSLALKPLPKEDFGSAPAGQMPVCKPSSFVSFMDYRAITAIGSPHYALQQQATTGPDGYRYLNGDLMVAMGRMYGPVGRRYRLHFANGVTQTVIIGDIKGANMCAHPDGSMLEVIVDSQRVSGQVWAMGSIPEISSPIIKIDIL